MARSFGTRPHSLLGLRLSGGAALAFDTTVMRASDRAKRFQLNLMMQQMGARDELGVGRVIALLAALYQEN